MSVFKEVRKYYTIDESEIYEKVDKEGEIERTNITVVDCKELVGTAGFEFEVIARTNGFKTHVHYQHIIKGFIDKEDAYEHLIQILQYNFGAII